MEPYSIALNENSVKKKRKFLKINIVDTLVYGGH